MSNTLLIFSHRAKPTSRKSIVTQCLACKRDFAYLPSQSKGEVCSRKCRGVYRKTVEGPQRFWARVLFRGPDECWDWLGYPGFQGRGLVTVDYVPRTAAVAAFKYSNGTIPKGMYVCHKCDNPSCCNPNHLFLGTAKQNSEDMVKKGRSCKGILHPMAKLNDKKVLKIREFFKKGKSVAYLVIRFGVGKNQIKSIVARRSWGHL